jgi:hypothetical protein
VIVDPKAEVQGVRRSIKTTTGLRRHTPHTGVGVAGILKAVTHHAQERTSGGLGRFLDEFPVFPFQ